MREKTLAEIQDENEAIRKGIKDGFDAINKRLDSFEQSFVRKDLYETRHLHIQERVASQERACALEIQRLEKAYQLEVARVERQAGTTSMDLAALKKDMDDGFDKINAKSSKVLWSVLGGILFPTIVGLLILLFSNGAFS